MLLRDWKHHFRTPDFKNPQMYRDRGWRNAVLNQWDEDASPDLLREWQAFALGERLKQYAEHPWFQEQGLRVNMTPDDVRERRLRLDVSQAQEYFSSSSFQERWVTQGHIVAYFLSSGTTAAKRKVFPVTSEAFPSFERAVAFERPLVSSFRAHVGRDMETGFELVVTAARGREIYREKPVIPMSWFMFAGLNEQPISSVGDFHYTAFFTPDFQVRPELSLNDLTKVNITTLSGMPPYILMMFRALRKRFGISKFQEIWPKLHLYRVFGFNRHSFLRDLNEAFGNENVGFFETYAASEGILGGQRNVEPWDFQIAPYDCYFEFEDVDSGERLLAHEVKVDHTYELLITSATGALWHPIGDCVRVTQTSPLRFVVAGRSDESIRIVSGTISLENLRGWLTQSTARFQEELGAFVVCPNEQRNGYEFVIESPRLLENTELRNSLQITLDELMQAENTYYARSRHVGTLLPPLVRSVPSGFLAQYLIRKDAFGQGKYRHVYTDREALTRLFEAMDLSGAIDK